MKIKTNITRHAARLTLALALLSTLNPQLSTVFAQGTTAFTYNGRLTDNGGVPNGNYLMYFALFPTNFGGPLLSGITNAVPVSNGLFRVTLDFGSGFFDGAARWLEVGVRTNGGIPFTTLQPRQQVLPTPYALMASQAASVSGGAIYSANIAAGQVVRSFNGMRDDVTLQAGANVTLTPLTNGNLAISATAGSGPFSLNGSNAYYNGGSVGIGTTNPAALLQVVPADSGGIAIGSDAPGRTYLGISITGGSGAYSRIQSVRSSVTVGGWGDISLNPFGGNVGISMTNPFANLDVNGIFGLFGGGLNGSTLQRFILYADTGNGLLFEAPKDGGGNKLAYHFNWRGGGTDAMTLLGNGNVGIGTASPSASLHIANRAQSYVRVVSTNTQNGSVLDLWNTTPYGPDLPDPNFGAINFSDGVNFPGQIAYNVGTGFTFRSGGVNALIIGTGPYVGIGRTPTANNLEVAGSASKSVAGSWLANSDRRIKKDVESLTGALDKLERVRPVRFRYTDEYRRSHPGVEDREYLNVVAQEFREVFPDDVKTSGEKLPDGSDILQVDTYPLTIYSAAAIQELNRDLKLKDAQIAKLQRRLENLEERLDRLTKP